MIITNEELDYSARPRESGQGRALIVPALQSSPSDHWYQDLRERLLAAGYDGVDIAALPQGEARLEEWFAAIDAAAGDAAHTAIIGHSLGGAAALAWITRRGVQSIHTFLGVGSFIEPLPHLPAASEFVSAVDSALIRSTVPRRVLALSENDYAVAPAMTERAADDLEAQLARFAEAGHFLRQDGWTDAAPFVTLLNAPIL